MFLVSLQEHLLISALKITSPDSLPDMTRANFSRVAFHYPFGQMTLMDLKLIFTTLKRTEVTVLRAKFGDELEADGIGWFSDFVVDAFFYEIWKTDDVIILSSSITAMMLSDEVPLNEKFKLLPDFKGFKHAQYALKWDSCKTVIFPAVINHNHWKLIVLFLEEKEMICKCLCVYQNLNDLQRNPHVQICFI